MVDAGYQKLTLLKKEKTSVPGKKRPLSNLEFELKCIGDEAKSGVATLIPTLDVRRATFGAGTFSAFY